jgi:rod shape determining protein RodA
MSGSDNTNQSEIAIGSGGWLGKRTSRAPNQRRFVPEQHTDYIFTTVGEEWGFAGSVVMALFAGLLLRIIYLAERQKQNSVGFMVTVLQEFYLPTCKYCMVSGIFPTIGVPLPFFSYGGSGLWGLQFYYLFYQNGCK